MVLEKLSQLILFRERWMDAFSNGFLLALIGIIVAMLFFPGNAGIVGVFLSSLALMPGVRRMISVTEILEGRQKEISRENVTMIDFSVARQEISPVHLLRDNRIVFEVFIFIFLGMISCFLLIFLVLPQQTVEILFKQQLSIANVGTATGTAYYETLAIFLANNFYVLVVSFIIALLFAEGAVLIVSWNSAYWAAVIVLLARDIAVRQSQNLATQVFLIFLAILPHMYLEMLAYISAIVAGALMSKAASREKLFGERFNHITIDAVIILFWSAVILVAAAWIETFIAPQSYRLLFGLQ